MTRGEPIAPTIHLVAIGSELLNGETRDTNLAWLIHFFTRKAGQVLRAVLIPDDFDSVKWEIERARSEGIDLMVTTGGLGPTDDDATLAAIARSLEVPLKPNEEALGLVMERISAMARFRPGIPHKLTKERKGMALFPQGGIPLGNPAGVAPGMLHTVQGTTLVAVPGVPAEMRGIIRETLRDFWKDFFEGVCYLRRNIIVKGIPEAELAPYMRRANTVDPGVYIKSKLKVVGKIVATDKVCPPEKLPWEIVLHFSIIECTRGDGKRRTDRLVDSLVSDLRKRYKHPLHIDLRPGRV